MDMAEKINLLVSKITDAYRFFHGFEANVEVRIVGYAHPWKKGHGNFFVVAINERGLECSRLIHPFNTQATARKHAKEFAFGLEQAAKHMRDLNRPHRVNFDRHVTDRTLFLRDEAQRRLDDAEWEAARARSALRRAA
jgi:hypothetical protein